MTWTILNIQDNILTVLAFLNVENNDKCRYQRYKNNGEGNPINNRHNINKLEWKNGEIAKFIIEKSLSLKAIIYIPTDAVMGF